MGGQDSQDLVWKIPHFSFQFLIPAVWETTEATWIQQQEGRDSPASPWQLLLQDYSQHSTDEKYGYKRGAAFLSNIPIMY